MPGVALPAFTVKVDPLPAATEVGLSVAVAPAGAPVAFNATVPAEPMTVVEMAEVPEMFWARLKVVGLAEIEKSLATVPPQPGNLKLPIRVAQLNAPVTGMYSFVYQNVQSSLGSTLMLE